MKHIKPQFGFILAILSFLVLVSCADKQEKKHKKKDKQEKTVAASETLNVKDSNVSIDCDTSYWRYVYKPERLQVIDKCKTVTGVIEESNVEEDGDQHLLLKLDNGQEDLLTKKILRKNREILLLKQYAPTSPQ
ncbi:hypothetical protein [Chitinophaga sp. MD30]|uniref:hypothetical protein n=1 Tax=Chitinophaga sp. MD30 TaxID=2033437 RepID=UPI000BB01B6E|nr:hypothetical protein [Chitinophaga sp. MD30]ASZ09605.1 hypothetical protein CK934_00740 [Chitinophaga sp. MD30]